MVRSLYRLGLFLRNPRQQCSMLAKTCTARQVGQRTSRSGAFAFRPPEPNLWSIIQWSVHEELAILHNQ